MEPKTRFTDFVSSTEQAARVGDSRWRETLKAHNEMARRQVARLGGRLVKTMGDGILATLDGPARAIRCASAIGDAVQKPGIDVRAGVHAGEVELLGDDVGGVGVHVAARVMSLAGPGEVFVSSTVKDLVVGSGISFEDRGAHELKGVPDAWRIYAVKA